MPYARTLFQLLLVTFMLALTCSLSAAPGPGGPGPGGDLGGPGDPPPPPALKITSPSSGSTLPDGVVGQEYTPLPITVTGGVPPYTVQTPFSSTPDGLSITQNAADEWEIIGTPTSATQYHLITLQAQDSVGASSPVVATSIIIIDPILLESSWFGVGIEGQEYTNTTPLVANGGGIPPYIFENATGLPAGLSMNEEGMLSGTPEPGTASAEPYLVHLEYHDSTITPAIFEADVSILIVEPLEALASELPAASEGENYDPYLLPMTGGTAPYTYELVEGMPTGISLSNDGLITGIPGCDLLVGAPYNPVVRITDASLPEAIMIEVNTLSMPIASTTSTTQPLSIETDSLPVMEEGQAINLPLQASGGFGSILWEIDGLPSGLFTAYIDKTWSIMGAPQAGSAGNYSLTLYAEDSCHIPQANVKTGVSLKIIENDPSLTLTILTNDLPYAQVGKSYGTKYLSAAGGTKPYTFSANGLPPGILLLQSAETGLWFLSGMPTQTGSFETMITLQDASDATQSTKLAMEVLAAAPEQSTLDSSSATQPTLDALASAAGSCSISRTHNHIPLSLIALFLVLVATRRSHARNSNRLS